MMKAVNSIKRFVWGAGDFEVEVTKENPNVEDQPRDETGQWAETGAEVGAKYSPKAQRAIQSYKPATRAIQRQADRSEKKLTKIIPGSRRTGDNAPFDHVIGDPPTDMIEVKTIVRAGNDKITMHGDALSRKVEASRASGAKVHTVVFDTRSDKIYYADRLGSMRLSAMNEVSEGQLSNLIGGRR